MSMNFNPKPVSTPTPAPKKNNNKHTAGIIIAVVLATIGAIGIIHHVMSIQDNMERGFSPSPRLSVSEVTNMCIEKLTDMFGGSPPKLSVNVCVGTVLEEINK